MTPASFIFVLTFVVMLLPVGISKDISVGKEANMKNHSSIPVNLHITSSQKNHTNKNATITKENLTEKAVESEIYPDTLMEEVIEIESWMSDPKNWNNK